MKIASIVSIGNEVISGQTLDTNAAYLSRELLKAGGKLMLVGIPRTDRISVSIDKARRKELRLINVRIQNKCTGPAMELIASGKINVDFMITHRFRLEQVEEAFEMVAHYRDGVVEPLIEL